MQGGAGRDVTPAHLAHLKDATLASLTVPFLSGLELLTAVVETGSFVRAGERVGLTQSGVSRAVARLEAQVGVRLFDRNARAVTLTDEGRRFHERVAPLLTALGEAVDSAAGSAQRVRGRLRVHVDTFVARYILAPRLDAFLASYPELELEVLSRPNDQVTALVADGFDVAIRFGEPPPSSLVARKLLATRIMTCASPKYVARHGHPRHPRDLARGHECIHFLDPQTGRPFEWEFHRGKHRIGPVPVHGRLVVNDVATALGVCLAGHGIVQLMELGNEELLRSGALVELFPKWHDELFPLYVFHPSRHLPPAKVRAFVDFVIASTKGAR
jgi:DNA-binding transcriptional LysR family regulator